MRGDENETPEWFVERDSDPPFRRPPRSELRVEFVPRPAPPAAPRRRRRRRSRLGLIGPPAGAMALVLLLGGGAYSLTGAGSCSEAGTITLRVSATADLAPAVTSIATRFNEGRHGVDGRCVRAAVTAAEPEAVRTLLSGQGVSDGARQRPDVWIPDSGLWPPLVQGDQKVRAGGTSLAHSPIVIGMPRALATRLRAGGAFAEPSWDNLLQAAGGTAGGGVTKNPMIPPDMIKLLVPDPTRTGVGMGSLVLTRSLLTNDPNADAIFTGIVRTVRENTVPTVDAQFAALGRAGTGRQPVVLATEQRIWKHNRSGSGQPAVAVYPREGTLLMDYPYTVTTADPVRVRAAALLERAMNTGPARETVRALGFRSSDGTAPGTFGAATGVSPQRPRRLPAPAPAQVAAVVRGWRQLNLGIRMLTLLDISGSMAELVPGTRVTRVQATARGAQAGLSMLSKDSELGVWTFSTKLDGARDWREDVPIGPVGQRVGSGTRRQAILGALARLRAIPTGDTGLYDSLLAAYRTMQADYRPEMMNSVLLLTDGRNDDAEGISLGRLLATLERERDDRKPIQVFMVGFGKGVDTDELQRIARVTDGNVHVVHTPAQLQKVFLQEMSRRACAPDC